MQDLISRQAAIDAIDEQIALCDKALKSSEISMKDEYAVKVERASLVAFREILEYLPPAEPEQPMRTTGHWCDGYRRQTCSKCRYKGYKSMNFCPNCGADMRGESDG